MKVRGRILFGVVLSMAVAMSAWAGYGGRGTGMSVQTASVDNTSTIEVNNLLMVVSNVGAFAYDPTTTYGRTDGLYFPRGTERTVIYSAGIWVGAKVNGSPRVSVSEYTHEFSPGGMADGTFIPDQGRFHVYKISRGDDAESNPHYADWPFEDGAPALQNAAGGDSLDADGRRIPLLLGDQALYAVYNDANPGAHTNQAGSTQPLGLEIQQYVFAFDRSGALGNTIYLKFKIINKGSNHLEDTYVSLWCDPDVGDAGDDLVGCDTLLSLGYAYNDGPDGIYGETVPAVGYDFLQGPIVASPGDTAYQSGRAIPDHRNLPMTSFNKYVLGTDPGSSLEAYNYMRGLAPGGDSIVDPTTGEVTLFQVAGDPVAGTGWVDATSDDRRFMMTTGPFTMAVGDTQEVVIAVMVGQGADHLSSVSALRQTSEQAQAVFDLNYDIPFTPPQPSVWVQPLPNQIELIWGTEAEGDVQVSEVLGQEFVMEGYNIYQGETKAGPWKKIATFDVANGVSRIYRDAYDPDLGAIHRKLIQSGSDSGLRNHLTLTTDRIRGGRLVNYRSYYYAVTAYSYDKLNVEEYTVDGSVVGHLAEVLETRTQGHEAAPNSFSMDLVDTAEHVSGASEGLVVVRHLDPTQITGDSYEVTFNEDHTWNLLNQTTGETLLSNIDDQTGGFTNSVVDGMMVQASGPEPGIRDVLWEGGDQWVTSVNLGGPWFGGGFFPGSWFFGSSIKRFEDLVDVQIRFSNTVTQKAYQYDRTFPDAPVSYGYQGYRDIPLTAWDVSVDPPRQLNVCFVEQMDGTAQDNTWLPTDDWRDREYLFILNSDYSDTPDEFYTTRNLYDDATEFDVLYAWWPIVAEGHSNQELAAGNTISVSVEKFNTTDDRFVFRTLRAGSDIIEAGKASLSSVHPVPNPYYHYARDVKGNPSRAIKFVGLPRTDLTIEIYNLSGDLIRTLDENDMMDGDRDVLVWDVKTERGLPPASGIYIYRAIVPGVGEKVGKIAVFTEVEQVRRF